MKINRSISIDEDLWRTATEAAGALDRSFSWIVSDALRAALLRGTPVPGFSERVVRAVPSAVVTTGERIEKAPIYSPGFGASRPAPKGTKR